MSAWLPSPRSTRGASRSACGTRSSAPGLAARPSSTCVFAAARSPITSSSWRRSSSWPASATRKGSAPVVPYLDRNGVQIWYEEHGRGPAVLLTHGYGATATMWEPQIRGLDSYRLIVWDIRGHGRSDSPEDPSAYSVPACLADMAAILDACGVDRAVIGGLSLGGYLSLAFLLDYASYVRALMLFDTGPGYRKQEGRNAWNAMAERYAQVLAARGLAGLGSTGEVRPTDHRSARGLALAARGILTQHDARVIDA